METNLDPDDRALRLEAEDFRLVDADVVRDPAASGGSAVKIMTKRAFCSTEFFLPPGEYIVTIRVKAFDDEHDEFYLSVGNVTVPVKPSRYNQYVLCDQTIEFSLSNPGKGFVQFATFPSGKPVGETGMLVDSVEIWRKKEPE